MRSLAELINNPKPQKKHGFDRADTKILLQIPKHERSPELIAEILKRHEALVIKETKKTWAKFSHYIGSAIEYDDVLAAGRYGMLIGINRFNYRFNTEFSTYVLHWIRQAALREIENNMGQVRIPIHFQERLWKDQSRQKEGRLDPDWVKHCFFGNTSLDAPLETEDSTTIKDMLNSGLSMNVPRLPYPDSPELAVLRKDLRKRIEASLSVLKDKRNRAIIRMRFGLNEYDEPHTLEETGDFFGVTRERVRQIEKKYILKVQAVGLFDRDDSAVFLGVK